MGLKIGIRFLFVLTSMAMLVSCSVHKRKYQKGFYVDWHSSHTAKAKDNQVSALQPNADQNKTTNPSLPERIIATPAPATQPEPEFSFAPLPQDSACDELIFKDGSEVKAKVLEVGLQEIKYKKCDAPDGPMYLVRKSDLFMIKYANGTREVIKTEEPPKRTEYRSDLPTYRSNNRPARRVVPPSALFTFVLSILGLLARYIAIFIFINNPLLMVPTLFIIFSVALMIYSKRIYRDIKMQTDLYKGAGFAHTAFILALINLCINAVFLIFMLLLL